MDAVADKPLKFDWCANVYDGLVQWTATCVY